MKIFEFEIALSVSDYFEEDEDDAFDLAGEDYDSAEDRAKEEIRELIGEIPKEVKIESEFLEFDSSNPTHAGAYYLIIVTGPNKWVKELARLYKERWE